jgi:predicted transposase YbfD/YdcC
MDVAEFFFEVDDPRRDGSCFHVLSDIIMIVLCGYLSDCEGFVEVHDYALDKEDFLRQFLQLPGGIPSHDTMNRVFRRIDPAQLEAALGHWSQHIVEVLKGQHIAIDGKQLRGTTPAGKKQAPVQLVSVWAQAHRLCLAQEQVDEKANEIVAIPQLLKPLDIEGAVITIDAIGCQKELVALIVKKKADYIIGLKTNQDTLYNQVWDHFEKRKAALSQFVSRDLGHGRAEKRTVWVSHDLRWLDAAEEWAGLSSVVRVDSECWRGEGVHRASRYYISSLSMATPEQAGGYIRRHWSIENEQHWHLDITFEEDACQVRCDHAPRNLSTVRKLALGLITQEPSKMSLKRKRKKAARDNDYLMTLLVQLDT